MPGLWQHLINSKNKEVIGLPLTRLNDVKKYVTRARIIHQIVALVCRKFFLETEQGIITAHTIIPIIITVHKSSIGRARQRRGGGSSH